MSKYRIEQIQKRLNWLSIELVHEAYHDGYSIEGFKKELSILIDGLKKLQDEITKN
jgi:hypothetical protein